MALAAHSNSDRSAFWRVAQSVIDDVVHQFGEQDGLAAYPGLFCFRFKAKVNVAGQRLGDPVCNRMPDKAGQIQRLER